MMDEKKRGRGKGKHPALVHLNVRLPPDVVAFFKSKPNYTVRVREILIDYARSQQTTE